MNELELSQYPTIQHSEIQGSKEWLELRKNFDTASEAPAMMNASPYQTRTELLDYKKTGIQKDVDAGTQKRFDNGHTVEAMARTIVENEIGQDLFAETLSKAHLLASLDGKTLAGEIIFEHKAWNETYAAEMRETGEPVPFHYWQLEQQLLVSGDSEKAIFVLSDGTENKRLTVNYFSKPERRKDLLAGWKQFNADKETHVVEAVQAKAVAGVVIDLPAVHIESSGALIITSNLDVFGAALTVFLEHHLILKPETDDDFATMEAQIKTLKKAEDALDAEENRVLSQVVSIDEMKKIKAAYYKLARDNRLLAEKLVKNRKVEIKQEIVNECQSQLAAHIEKINASFGNLKLPIFPHDFGGALKNLRTITSLRDAAKSHLAECKIKANEIADLMRLNLQAMDNDHAFLFRDLQHIITKEHADFVNLVKLRVSDYKTAEEVKAQQKLIDDARKAEQAKAAEAFKETISATISEVKPEQFQAPTAQEPAPVAINKDIPTVSANDMLAMREFRIVLLNLQVPECESSKGDVMASKVKSLIQQAVNEINWIVN